MSIGNIVVNDAATTPVAHTFVPIQDGADARYVNEAGALTLKGQETLGVAIKRAANPSLAHTARITMWDPKEVTDANTGLPVIDHGNSADLRFNFSDKSTVQERKDIVKMSVNAALAKIDDIAGLIPQL